MKIVFIIENVPNFMHFNCTFILCFEPDILSIPSSLAPCVSKYSIISLNSSGSSVLGCLCRSDCKRTDSGVPNSLSSPIIVCKDKYKWQIKCYFNKYMY